MVYWGRVCSGLFELVCFSVRADCAHLFLTVLSDITFGGWNWPRWENLCWKSTMLQIRVFVSLFFSRELCIVKHTSAHYSVCVCVCVCMHTFWKFSFWKISQNNFKSSSSSPMHLKMVRYMFQQLQNLLTVSSCLFIFYSGKLVTVD